MNFVKKGNKFYFTHGDAKAQLVYSLPRIQGFSEFSTLKNANEIMYYYYDVKGYSGAEKSKKIFESYAYDNPSLLNLLDAIDEVLNATANDSIPMYKKYRNDKRNGWYMYSVEVQGDECYELYRFEQCLNNEEPYIFYRIKVYTYDDDASISGVVFYHLTHEDMRIFQRGIKEFIDYSIRQNNKIVNRRNTTFVESLEARAGKLYVKGEHDNYDIILAPGDVVDIVTATQDKNKIWTETMRQYKDVEATIMEIHDTEETAFIVVKYHISENPIQVIPISNIVYLHKDASSEELAYGANEVAKDFITILNEEDVEEILKGDDQTFYKYKHVIINRTWLCRSEHKLMDNPSIETIEPAAKEVYELAKHKLENM